MDQKQSTMEQIANSFTLAKVGESPAKAALPPDSTYQMQPPFRDTSPGEQHPKAEPSRDLSNEKMERNLPNDIHSLGPGAILLQKC